MSRDKCITLKPHHSLNKSVVQSFGAVVTKLAWYQNCLEPNLLGRDRADQRFQA